MEKKKVIIITGIALMVCILFAMHGKYYKINLSRVYDSEINDSSELKPIANIDTNEPEKEKDIITFPTFDKYPTFSELTDDIDFINIKDLYEKLADLNIKQTEFETNIEFEARKKEVIKNDAYLKKILSEYIIIEPEGITTGKMSFRYDVNTEGLYYSFPYQTINLFNTISNKGSYIGTNAFGVSKEIEKNTIRMYEIKINNQKQLSDLSEKKELCSDTNIRDKDCYKLTYDNHISMPPKTAEKIKPLIKTLYVFKVVKPYRDFDYITTEPTISEPEDSTTYFLRVVADLEGIIFYNEQNGEIIDNFRIDTNN